MDLFHEIIKKIGEELGVKVTLLSDDWITVLEKENKIHYIEAYRFDINNCCIAGIMDDKGLFYDLLRYKNIPIIEHKVIFKNYNSYEVLDYFNSHQQEIIVKGCVGNSGKEVYKITKEEDLFKVIDKLFIKEYSIALQPFYHILNEYRVIVLNNEVQLIFGKIKPFVIGDGKKNVLALAREIEFFKDENEIEKASYIPKLGEKVDLSFKFNLSNGAKSFTDIDENLKKKIIDLALKVTKETNISFASVDIIYTEKQELMVMEANTGVFMNNFIKQNANGYEKAYNVYKAAIKAMFDIK